MIRALIARFDPSQGSEYPIYSPEGEWSAWRFEHWLAAVGVTEWPRLDSGALQLDGDAFRMMYPAHPAIEGLHALREVLSVIVRARIPIGPDGRNRPSLFPFGTATGRNAQAKSLFNTHASMRSLMRFDPEKIGLYLDYRTEEVGIAAARSGDEVLARDYASGDVYHALARMCGLTTLEAKPWKATDAGKVQRQQMKAAQLGINYGMGVISLARSLGRHPIIGSEVIIRHQQRYPQFWAWRAEHCRACDAGTGHRVRVRRLAAAPVDLTEQAHTVQFPDAERRRRDPAAGLQPIVRSRSGAEHAGA